MKISLPEISNCLLHKSGTNYYFSLLSKIVDEHPTLGNLKTRLIMVAAPHDEATAWRYSKARGDLKKGEFALSCCVERIENKACESRFGVITEDRGGRRKKFDVTCLGGMLYTQLN